MQPAGLRVANVGNMDHVMHFKRHSVTGTARHCPRSLLSEEGLLTLSRGSGLMSILGQLMISVPFTPVY
jgi:hypothetical protein